MREIGLKSNEVLLYYEGTSLSTQYQKSEAGYSYYTASVQGLGRFVIGKKEDSKENAEITTVVKMQPNNVEETVPEQKEALVGKAYGQNDGSNLFYKIGKFFKDFLGIS